MSRKSRPFEIRTEETLRQLNDSGQYKTLQMIQSPMDARITLRSDDGRSREVLCFCSNNYLGLANEPRVVEAGIDGLRRYGAGTASVRFICGTFEAHERLEETIAEYMGTESSYTFVSCWTATEAFFPTVCEAGDIIISDELNHACIIDAMRLTPVIKKGVLKGVYSHSDMNSLREKLRETASNDAVTGQIWVVTDGVFSMEGDIANLPGIRALCDEFNAMLVVDDSHGHGVMGRTGRGTHEHYGMIGRNEIGKVDVFTGTLGKALGGGAGGFVAGSRELTDLLVQRARPTLFSNALPVTVACSATKAIEIVMDEPDRVLRLKNNVETAREKIGKAGFEVLASPTAICPIIVGETADAIRMSRRLLDLGVFVIGFGYPVVPEGTARLRIQMSAAHTDEHIDVLVDALKKL